MRGGGLSPLLRCDPNYSMPEPNPNDLADLLTPNNHCQLCFRHPHWQEIAWSVPVSLPTA